MNKPEARYFAYFKFGGILIAAGNERDLMNRMIPLPLSRTVLDWAAHKAGGTLQSFAESIAKRGSDRARIAGGYLTVPQAEKLARKASIPFGHLFLEQPPDRARPTIPDLRQAQGAWPLSADFYETLEDVRAKQDWLIEFRRESGAHVVPLVGRFAGNARCTAEGIAVDICRELDIGDDDRRRSPDAAAYFSRLSAKAEATGVLVFKAGHVKASTRRPLFVEEFRGFALADPVVPVVFVNGRDAQVAAVFTLIHELAHIWLGLTGVSDVIPSRFGNATEALCNRVAATVLVPMAEFEARWVGSQDLDELATHFRVSRLVIARRALDAGLVDQGLYDAVAASSRPVKRSGTPNALATIPIRNSRSFTRTIVASAMSGHTLLRDAASLLNVKPDTVMALAKGFRERER